MTLILQLYKVFRPEDLKERFFSRNTKQLCTGGNACQQLKKIIQVAGELRNVVAKLDIGIARLNITFASWISYYQILFLMRCPQVMLI